MLMHYLLRWPLLISLLSATFGLAVALFIGFRVFYGGLASWDTVDVWLPLMAAAFVILSIFIYSARAWARRALVALFLSIAAAMAFVGIFRASFDEAPLYIVNVGVLLFIVGVLCHPDVVAAFPREKRVNREPPSI
jgi:ABC-type Fe3+-siderophore transport system permease subunit